MTSEGTGNASVLTMSPGLGPANSASMRSSAIFCTAGRSPSTRLKVKGFDNIRR